MWGYIYVHMSQYIIIYYISRKSNASTDVHATVDVSSNGMIGDRAASCFLSMPSSSSFVNVNISYIHTARQRELPRELLKKPTRADTRPR